MDWTISLANIIKGFQNDLPLLFCYLFLELIDDCMQNFEGEYHHVIKVTRID